jgi:hypothetical protein
MALIQMATYVTMKATAPKRIDGTVDEKEIFLVKEVARPLIKVQSVTCHGDGSEPIVAWVNQEDLTVVGPPRRKPDPGGQRGCAGEGILYFSALHRGVPK